MGSPLEMHTPIPVGQGVHLSQLRTSPSYVGRSLMPDNRRCSCQRRLPTVPPAGPLRAAADAQRGVLLNAARGEAQKERVERAKGLRGGMEGSIVARPLSLSPVCFTPDPRRPTITYLTCLWWPLFVRPA